MTDENYIKLLEDQNEELKAKLAFKEKDQKIMLDQFFKYWKSYNDEYNKLTKFVGWNKNGNFIYDNLNSNHVNQMREFLLAVHALHNNMEGMLYRFSDE